MESLREEVCNEIGGVVQRLVANSIVPWGAAARAEDVPKHLSGIGQGDVGERGAVAEVVVENGVSARGERRRCPPDVLAAAPEQVIHVGGV